MTGPDLDRLRETLALDPGDEAAREALLVEADRLSTRGDPRGELMRIEEAIRSSADPSRSRALWVEHANVVAHHLDALLGLLAPLSATDGMLEVDWEFGMPRAIRLSSGKSSRLGRPLGFTGSPTAASLAAFVLALPQAASLRELEIRVPGRSPTFATQLTELAELPPLETVLLGEAPQARWRIRLGGWARQGEAAEVQPPLQRLVAQRDGFARHFPNLFLLAVGGEVLPLTAYDPAVGSERQLAELRRRLAEGPFDATLRTALGIGLWASARPLREGVLHMIGGLGWRARPYLRSMALMLGERWTPSAAALVETLRRLGPVAQPVAPVLGGMTEPSASTQTAVLREAARQAMQEIG